MSAARPTDADGAQSGAWQFFRASADGREVFQKEFDKLPRDDRAALAVLMRRYLAGDLRGGDDIKPLRDGIYELRCRRGSVHYRVLFVRWGPHPVALTAFSKNQQRTPQPDVERAIARRKVWKEAFGDGGT